MVFWSCTIYQLNPQCDRRIFEDIFTETGTSFHYDTILREDDDDLDLNLYIDTRTQNSQGTLFELAIDLLSPPFYARNKEPQRVVLTARLGLQIFNLEGWPYLVGVFASQQNCDLFRYAMTKIYADQSGERSRVLDRVVFRLRENEECLMNRFPNMKQLAVDQINDAHIRKAVIKGESLEESPLYEQWVLSGDSGGRVLYFGINVRGETVILGTLGNMYSRQGSTRFPIDTVQQLVGGLLQCRAMMYQSEITSYT